MRLIPRLTAVLLSTLTAFIMLHATTPTYKIPDFAYPQTVETDARAALAQADKDGGDNGPARLRALIELCTAQTAIDRDDAFKQPALVDSQASARGLGATSRAMLLTYEAYLYQSVYTNQAYKYNRVDAPLLPYPDDVALWSGEQFRTRIIALLDSAQTLAGNTPLAEYQIALDYSPEALYYLPSVADFVRYRRISAFEAFTYGGMNFAKEKSAVCREGIAASKEASAPFFFWSVKLAQLNPATEYDRLMELYSRYDTVEAARYVLAALCSSASRGSIAVAYRVDERQLSQERDDLLAALLRRSLQAFPGWYDNAALENRLATITRPRAQASVPSMVAPGRDFEVAISYDYAKTVTIGVYSIPANLSSLNPATIAATMPRTASLDINADNVHGKSSSTLAVPAPGRYALVLSVDGKIADGNAVSFDATPLMAFSVNGCSDAAAAAVDFTTGAPLKGVGVNSLTSKDRKISTAVIGKTDGKGIVRFDAPTGMDYPQRWLSFSYKGATYDLDRSVRVDNFNTVNDSTARPSIVVFTDRQLYHPGDTIAWAAVCGSKAMRDKSGKVLAGQTVTATLLDANREEVAKTRLTTDVLGRVFGQFATRKGGLTGSYTLKVAEPGGAESYTYLTVSDFKAPVFEVNVESVLRDVPASGSVTLEGTATTFSGMPVADASVAATLKGAYRNRWFIPARTLATVDVRTDASGRFKVVFDAEMLDKSEFNDFVADFTVTSATAETASASRSFTTGRPYSLSLSLPELVNADKPLSLKVEAYDANGVPTPLSYTWRMVDASKTKGLPAGTATAGRPVDVDLTRLAAGTYTFEIAAADTLQAASVVSTPVDIYSIERNSLPANVKGFLLTSNTVKADGRTARITVGTNASKLYLYTAVSDAYDLHSVDLTELRRGFSTVKIDLPQDPDKCLVRLMTVIDGKLYSSAVNIEQPAAAKTEIVAESFRDKLTPGASETWRFRLQSAGKGVHDAGFIATMYNRSLDALQQGNWASGFFFRPQRYRLTTGAPTLYDHSVSAQVPYVFKTQYSMKWPAYVFEGAGMVMYNAPMMKSALTIRGRSNNAAASADTASAAPIEDLLIVEDSAESEEAYYAGSASEPKVEYRDAEVLQALWQPALISDSKGNVDIVFTVPNANTTWQFKAFGWTPSLDCATYEGLALASKPVMVQPSLPRFLRQGDTARIAATVYNRRDEVQRVVTTVELFDIASGEVYKTATAVDTIAPQGSAVATIEVDAPADASAIGYRVRAVAGSYADGEQAAIPVLSSAATVIESSTFYLNPGDTKPFTLKLKPAADAKITLQYSNNPVWSVVKAMRGIAATETLTSTSAASRLFSALAAKYIVTRNPAIAEAIRIWSDNPSEEALVSMLERNSDLKTLMLDRTPWVQAAQSNSARMAALADLLDPDKADKAIARYKEVLAGMQTSDGAFAWGSWAMQPSEWSTQTVLTTLGIARSLGMLPADFDAMLQPAFSYLQTCATKAGRPATDRALTTIATFFPDYKTSLGASRIISATVASVAAKWRNDNTVGKALDILILKAHGRCAEAARVLASVRQFAVVRPGMGLCFPNVTDMRDYATIIQAYAAMDADQKDIDAMRQWVIVQTQALDDFGVARPDYIIAAVLLTGTDWTTATPEAKITVNGHALDTSSAESASGYFAKALQPADGRLNLVIEPSGMTPSYGSVTTIESRPATAVKARPGKDLSIEKRCLVLRDGAWVETTGFSAGERVRIQLTVKATRDMEYVSITDERAATFAPVDQLPGYVWDGGLGFYRENLDASTRLFISYLPKGAYHLSFDMTATLPGSFSSGIATIQSQYAPELTAHSAGSVINVE